VVPGGGLGVEAGRPSPQPRMRPARSSSARANMPLYSSKERPPRDDRVPFDRHLLSPLPSQTAPAPQRRFSAEPREPPSSTPPNEAGDFHPARTPPQTLPTPPWPRLERPPWRARPDEGRPMPEAEAIRAAVE
jgi:hypothetical protein